MFTVFGSGHFICAAGSNFSVCYHCVVNQEQYSGLWGPMQWGSIWTNWIALKRHFESLKNTLITQNLLNKSRGTHSQNGEEIIQLSCCRRRFPCGCHGSKGGCRAGGDAAINHLSERRSGCFGSQAALSRSDGSHSQGLRARHHGRYPGPTGALFCSCRLSRTSCQGRTGYPAAVCLIHRWLKMK